jgi:Domain of unknown function (DUF397)
MSNINIEINGSIFKKSSFSGVSSCVGVEVTIDKIRVVNTKEKNTVIEFTYPEWDAFITGVKNNEFDINKT